MPKNPLTEFEEIKEEIKAIEQELRRRSQKAAKELSDIILKTVALMNAECMQEALEMMMIYHALPAEEQDILQAKLHEMIDNENPPL